MKRLILFFSSLFLCFLSSFGQLAVVIDEGGFVNIYDEENQELDRLGSDGVVAILEEKEDLVLVDYTKYGGYAASSGYIKKEKLIDLSTLQEIPITKLDDKTVILSNAEINIKLSTKEFRKSDNKLTYSSGKGNTSISAINEAPYWGTKLGLPSRQYDSVEVEKNGIEISVPTEGLFNLFNPHLSFTKSYYNEENDTIYIYSSNGDASGAYMVLWLIEYDEYGLHYIFD